MNRAEVLRRGVAPATQTIAGQWNHRSAVRLSNGVMEAVLLRSGGHIAELRLTTQDGDGVNCLWAAPWPTADTRDPRFDALAEAYGSSFVGSFLAGYTGHALCLDIFGPPSEQDAARGVSLHGEAASREWIFENTTRGCVGRIELPVAQLALERDVSLAEDAAVMFVEERMENRSTAAREIHWVQHLSLGAPLLEPEHSVIDASLDRAKTWPLGYEGREMLRSDAVFTWPHAPALDQDDTGTLDLRFPFSRIGYGFVAAARVNTSRESAYISALNTRLGLALIYGFRRQDFPWVAIWEENCARSGAPWHSNAQVRGMEFGTTPMPVGREAIRTMGDLFDTPGARTIEAGGVLHARYFAAITAVPRHWRGISDVTPGRDALTITGTDEGESITVTVEGIADFLREGRIEK